MENNKPTYEGAINTTIQTTFFGKVMIFFSAAMLLSSAGVFIGAKYLMEIFLTKPFLMFALFIVEIALIWTSRRWSQTRPLNFILFTAFAIISGITAAPLIGIVASTPQGMILLYKALGATGLMFTASAIIGATTKRDLSSMAGFLMMALIGMIIVGVIGMFVPWGSTFEMVFSGIGIIVFSAFTAYDFQMIKRYPENRYMEAAIHLYLDIFNLFLFILRMLLALNGRD